MTMHIDLHKMWTIIQLYIQSYLTSMESAVKQTTVKVLSVTNRYFI